MIETGLYTADNVRHKLEKSAGQHQVLVIARDIEKANRLISQLSLANEFETTAKTIPFEEHASWHYNEYDLILIDVSMPQPPEWSVFEKIKERNLYIPIVGLVHNDTQGIEAIKYGAQEYLIDGECSPRMLRRTLKYILQHNRITKKLQLIKQKADSALAISSQLYKMSTKLKTPINVLLEFTETMTQGRVGPAGSSRYEDCVSDTHKCATHLNALIENMIGVSRI